MHTGEAYPNIFLFLNLIIIGMKKSALLLSVLFLVFLNSACAQKMKNKEIIYVGTYSQKGEGIYIYNFDRKNLTWELIQLLPNRKSASFLSFDPSKKFMYTSNEGTGTVESYRVDQSTGKIEAINEKPAQGNGPCHVQLDPNGKFLFVSNYGSGDLAVYRLNSDGSIGDLADSIQHFGTGKQKPHMHSMIPSPDGRFVYASDLGVDKVFIYAVDQQTGKLSPAAQPFAQLADGAGPRHFDIHPNGKFAYSCAELNNTVTAYRLDKESGGLTQLQVISMLPEGFTQTSYAADIHFSPDGKFLYASNRGHESIVIYKVDENTGMLTLVGHEPTRGKHPRNFLMDTKGELVMVANRDNDNVVIYKRDKKSGKLTFTGKEIKVPTPVCVEQLILK